MVELIRQQGVAISVAQVREIAGDGTIGRPHIAAAIVEAGACTDLAAAFDRFLLPGVPTYVARYKPGVGQAIRTVTGSWWRRSDRFTPEGTSAASLGVTSPS